MKNLTPLKLSLLISTIISLIIGLLSSIYSIIDGFQNWFIIPLFVFCSWIVCFLIISYFIERFIYRKIKLIYKSIHNLKATGRLLPTGVDISKDIFTEMEDEVNDWAINKKQEYEDMKTMAEYRREFLANVSHELKSPIFNMQGYLHTLIDGSLQDKNISLRYLQKAATNLDNLANIVRDLEIISRFEAGELPVEFGKFDIHELVKELIDSYEITADRKEISISFKDGCDRSFSVYADKDKIKQVIANLIANSIRYGKVRGKTQIGLYDMHNHILIEVSDDGIGIAPEHLPRLFERFYRVDKARSRTAKGTGLGLAIAKHIVEAHGQRINVRSTTDIGSTFGFTLKKA